MARLKFEMNIHYSIRKERDGYISVFTDGTGWATQSWWSSPPSSIDHVGPEYLKNPHRHPNVRNNRHQTFIKKRFKEEVARIKQEAQHETTRKD